MTAAIERLWRRVQDSIGFGTITAPTQEAGTVSKAQLARSPIQTSDNVVHLQHFGFASSPPVGSDAVYVGKAGSSSNVVIIATGHQTYRFVNLGGGESVLYDQFGHYVRLTAAGIVSDGNWVHTGNFAVTGNITATGDITAGEGGADSITLQNHLHINTQPQAGQVSGIPKAGT